MAFTLACPVFCGVYGVVDNWSGRSDVCKEVKFLSPSARIRRSRGNVYAGSQWNKLDEVNDCNSNQPETLHFMYAGSIRTSLLKCEDVSLCEHPETLLRFDLEV